ncbi:hypothetical protein [Candidatus Magnetominusculus xianensis]|uniref:Uncharacterized protein n=1 Tax=Candidatus Magnetominusculus xianensis TaxID=1748249 RepID=A0ABR5SHP6_9BACT|nr:hypothetical protein [Candidatus Magnetominusculus xianensis]KWT91684.1 hypothetical protein ASN18_0802 [Candidatus Magnetominusculus xianensis]MBF0404561.1 hypothetical protein [Nitrospirota bacterium]
MTSVERVKYINEYSDDKDSEFRLDFTRINLASSIRKFVSNDPVSYSHDLEPLLKIPRKYQYEILRGFEEAWKNNKEFKWDKILSFIEAILGSADFWTSKSEGNEYNYNLWITNTTADLITEGVKNDRPAFTPELLPIVERILLVFIDKVKSDIKTSDIKTVNYFVTKVINSSMEKVFIAAINYSFHFTKLYSKSKINRWNESMKKEFTDRLDGTKDRSIEFSFVAGWYISYLYFIDKKWTTDYFNKIFDLNNDEQWESAFTGYIVMNSTIDDVFYKLHKEHGHYNKALNFEFADKFAADKVVQHIVLGYLADWESTTDKNSLIKKMVIAGNTKQLSEMVSFVWQFRDKINEKIRTKVKPLWKMIINIISPMLKVNDHLIDREQYSIIASKLGNWLCLVDTIDDDIKNWLDDTISSIEENNDGLFVEYLLSHVENTPEKVGEIYIKMLNAGTFPTYPKEDIAAIVQALNKTSQKEMVDRIRNLYIGKGLLVEVFRALES